MINLLFNQMLIFIFSLEKRKKMASMFLLSLLLLTSTLYMVKSEEEEVIYCAVCLFHFLKPKHCDCSYYHHRWSTMNFKEENSPDFQESRRHKVRHQKQVQRHQRLYFIGKWLVKNWTWANLFKLYNKEFVMLLSCFVVNC
jgi:hypothetical protein